MELLFGMCIVEKDFVEEFGISCIFVYEVV